MINQRIKKQMIAVSLLAPLAVLHVAVAVTPFQTGDRWCVLGDSITEGGYYHRYVELFYYTRFPTQQLEVVDCGIRGETAPGALRRLQWDCLEAKPTVVSVMLGMNDVGRSFYKYQDSQDFDKKCKERAETYDHSLRTLTKSLLDSGAKVILIKPSIFDDTADLTTPNLPGCGAALAGYAARMQAIAEEFKLATVDFNGSMSAINAEQQKRDPHFSIVGPDRVHPTQPGHMVMAYELLRAQKLSGVVSRISVDVAATQADANENCDVTGVRKLPNGISFTCIEKALPFPVETSARAALDFVPFTQEFNQETLIVRGLSQGDYELSIDSKKIRSFTAAQLAEGVNLAGEVETPQFQQSLAVKAAFAKKWQAESKLRSIAFIEHNAWPDAKRPLDAARASAELDLALPKIAGTNSSWAAMLRKNYLQSKSHEADLRREMLDAVNAARLAAQPKPHTFTLCRLRK
ncbi:MAG: SGNH/GDSL hydrolase family protein [bacterium]